MLVEGRRVGRYMLHAPIGSGALATVHLGYAEGAQGFRRVVAIKRLHEELASDPEVRAMLVDEGRLLARIQHRAVVSVLDVIGTGAGSDLWLVTEYVHGESLARLLDACLERGRSTDPALAVAIVVEALRGLAAAHGACNERGEPLDLVHRDVSPQNILVGEEGSVKVADFGVARATGRLQVTREGQKKGTLSYMAPEQLRGGTVDARADVFSAAVILWEALTLRRLFDGASHVAVADRVAAGPIDRPSRVEPRVPAVLDAIVLRGLAKQPEDRWPSAVAFADALEAAVAAPKSGAIGAWVRELAGDALAERSKLLLAMGELDEPTRLVERAARAEPIAPALGADHGPRAAPRRARSRTAALTAMAAAALTAGFVVARSGPQVDAAARSSASQVALVAGAVTAAPPIVEPPPAAPADTVSEVSASATPAPKATSHRSRATTPPTQVTRPAACEPPYVIDDRGIVRPKRECL